MYNIVALMGEAGSGKDRTLKEVLAAAPHYHEIISCTTRPMREGEVEGQKYNFISREKFEDMLFTMGIPTMDSRMKFESLNEDHTFLRPSGSSSKFTLEEMVEMILILLN